jgi:hypothetical protein
MMEYKYVNDTEAALKKIKAECRIKKCKPSFNVMVGQHNHEMMEGTIKQVEYILHHHNETVKRYRGYDFIKNADSCVEITVFHHGGVWVRVDLNTTRAEEDEEE